MDDVALASPGTERKHIENEKLREEWSGCCSKSDKHFVKFLTQLGFGASLVVFAMIQTARDDVENKEIYFSLISGIVGTFLPYPTLKEKQ